MVAISLLCAQHLYIYMYINPLPTPLTFISVSFRCCVLIGLFFAVLDDRARRQASGEASGDEPVRADVG